MIQDLYQQHAHARAAQTSARAEHVYLRCVELIQIIVAVLSTVVLAQYFRLARENVVAVENVAAEIRTAMLRQD